MDTTILIPARIRNVQELEWLKAAVASAGGQGRIIVAYNNSTHKPLPKFSKKAEVHTIDAPNLATARNFLVSKVKTPYFFFLDADDLLPPDTISKMEEFIKTVPEQRYVYGGTLIFGEGQLEVPARDFDCKTLTQGVYFPNGVLQPIQNMKLVGGWDETMEVLEDKEWWIRAADQNVCGVPFKGEITYKYRQHEDSMVATYRNTVAWKTALKYIEEKHKAFYKGEYSMCCGNQPSTQIATATVLAEPNGEEIQIHYMLGTGNASYWGVVSGRKYVVSANQPYVNIDARDAETSDPRRPGLLQLMRNNRHVFVKV